MHATEVVPCVPQGDHVRVVLKLLAECVRQPGEPPHTHSHVEVLAFDVRSRDVLRIGVACDRLWDCADTSRGAVSGVRFKVTPVNLHQHCVVDASAERILNGGQVHPVAVRGQLNAVRQPGLNVLKEYRCKPRVSLPHQPADNEFRLGFNGSEGPNVSTDTVSLDFLLGYVFLFTADKRPDFINLHALRLDIANHAVVELSTGRADTHQQAEDSALRHTSHAGSGANGATFDQRRDDRDFLRHADYICHDFSIRYRFRIVNSKDQERRFSGGFLYFCPSSFSSFSGASFPLFVGHSFQSALAADLAALRPHLPHDLLNNSKFNGFNGADGLYGDPAGVLYGIKFFSIACALWHNYKRGTKREERQAMQISNGPTTENGICVLSRVAIQRIDDSPVPLESAVRWLDIYLTDQTFGLTVVNILGSGAGVTSGEKRGAAKSRFWAALLAACATRVGQSFLLLGDFNTGLHGMDEVGRTFYCVEHFARLSALGWTDVWRQFHGEKVEFTWYPILKGGRVGNGFRLDHAFATPSLLARLTDCRYSHSERESKISDHSLMIVEFM
jgi:exodeoxyribonuclease III